MKSANLISCPNLSKVEMTPLIVLIYCNNIAVQNIVHVPNTGHTKFVAIQPTVTVKKYSIIINIRFSTF
jgi:hypothetical protein